MKFVVGTNSKIKLDALRHALAACHVDAEIVAVKTSSGVAEQPINFETYTGAINRMEAARDAVPGADYYIGIENGIFQTQGKYVDRAVVVCLSAQGKRTHAVSADVDFPEDSVLESARSDFTKTAGQIMAERGIVAKADDPHLSLCGRSRGTLLSETLERLVYELQRAARDVAPSASAPKPA